MASTSTASSRTFERLCVGTCQRWRSIAEEGNEEARIKEASEKEVEFVKGVVRDAAVREAGMPGVRSSFAAGGSQGRGGSLLENLFGQDAEVRDQQQSR